MSLGKFGCRAEIIDSRLVEDGLLNVDDPIDCLLSVEGQSR